MEKKEYTTPKAEKIDFDYTEAVAASNSCNGGIYRLFVEGYDNCHDKPTDTWVNPFGNQ